jgi:glycosyltransferase involved in cell wall biosynthesis
MNILFLTLARIEDVEQSGIYQDLLRKFRDEGHYVTIVNPQERKFKKSTSFTFENGVNILSVWTTNFQKTNLLEKGITILFIEYLYFLSIKKYVQYKKIDLILYSTPPITFTNLIRKLKKQTNATTYLLLKDIFPQNAVDLDLFKKNSLLYKYFKRKEKILYKISDFIGCMSPANKQYILKENPEIREDKIEINPNSIEVLNISNKNFTSKDLLLKYKIPLDKTLFLFGGNLGLPQGIEFLKKQIANCSSIQEAFFLIIGNGTEFESLKKWIESNQLNNVALIQELSKTDYEEITRFAQVGLIFLNPKFTIPNFPSRILSYMQNKLPVICATDINTDIGTITSENGFGYNCLTNDLELFYTFVTKLLNENLRVEMGNKAFKFLKKEYSVESSYYKIIEKMNHRY